MNNDSLGILLKAVIDQDTKAINDQIKSLSTKIDKLKIKLDIDATDLANMNKVMKDLNDQIRKYSNPTSTNPSSQSDPKKKISEIDNLILKYKAATISATEFMNAGRKMADDNNLPLRERAKLIQALTSAEKTYASTINQENKNNTAISDRNKALEQQKLKEEQLNKTIQERIKLYQQSFTIQSDKLTGKYGSLVDSNALNNLQGKVSGLNVKDYDANKLKEYNLELQRIQTNAINSGKALKLGQQDAISFGAEIIRSAKKFTEWYLLAGGVTGAINAIKNGIQYIFELDNALNEIRIVTGQTVEQVNALGLSYNKLAKEMGVTTKEIVNTSVDLYRQGLDQSQVEDRMKSIIQYAKISSISLEDSNKIITATANATGESVTKIIDIFALLGDTTSSGKISASLLSNK